MSEKKLTINVANVNVKKIDQKAYGITKQMCQVKLKVDDKEAQTKEQQGLDPTWEESFEFPIADENTTKCQATFYMDGMQIGDTHDYLINTLVIGKPIFKAIIVPGGQVNMLFTATGFGQEEQETDTSAFLDMMDGGEMIMDD